MYNVKFILYTHVFSGIKRVNHGTLDIAEALIHLLDKYVSM
jgi:hypothetical protein